MRALRDDEDVASILGVNAVKWRTFVFSLSGFLAGIAGGFYAHFVQVITPNMLSLGEMGTILAIAVVGGLGTFEGSILAGFFLHFLSEFIRGNFGEYHLIIFGLLLIITLKFIRGGLVEFIKRSTKVLS